jgi:predicted ArsR family transcriptional regulator
MPSPQQRILYSLKSRGPQTAADLARHFAITLPAMRKHLAALAARALIAPEDQAGRVGRPRRFWKLTPAADRHFPDSHAALTLDLIDAIRELVGETGLDQLIALRERQMLRRYQAEIARHSSLAAKVESLAALRTAEGYMAECRADADGALLLIENHCPICAAATACQGFCRSELSLFGRVLGPDVSLERIDHIPAGARRCAYRIAAR